MTVLITREAEGDLEAIADYIAIDNPQAAVQFVRDIREKCHDIARFPRRFPLVDGISASDIRKRSFGNYLIFYKIHADHIAVLHVVHGATDYSGNLD
jgi:toxin ParE1/3/4